MLGEWLRIAHRGASGTHPEHTRLAFERAMALGVDMIELDVQLSRDNALVVIHDADVGRTTNGRGGVRAHDLASLRRLDAGAWFGPSFAGERILTLDEVFGLVGARVALNIEVKAPTHDWPLLVPRLIASLRRHAALRSALVSCFEPRALARLREQSADVRLGVLWQDADLSTAWAWARELGAVSIHPHWTLASEPTIRRAHDGGLQVLVWTVNDVGTMSRLVACGVDGIMSDFPERFAHVRRSATRDPTRATAKSGSVS